MDSLGELIGDSAAMKAVRQKVRRLLERQGDARRLPSILLQGETGTGKGLLARALHRASHRQAGAFVDVNCAAIPETLLEAEMFGFERGAFTDAHKAKAGLFEAASGGSIFLDEVALVPEAVQAKLLKVIEERTVRRLGSTRNEPIDVWIITGTNEDLAAAVKARRFRDDLYHRLAVVTIELPPLRGRGDDVVVLAEHFLGRACADYNLPPKRLDESARLALRAYPWPGNVRELGNVMERVALLSEARDVSAAMLGLTETPRGRAVATPERPAGGLDHTVETLERQHLVEALDASGWNISRAAVRLRISRNAVRWRIEKYGLRRDGGPDVAPRAHGRSVTNGDAGRRPSQSIALAPHVPDPTPAQTTIRWERRRVTVLRADLIPAAGHEGPVDFGRRLPAVLEKLRTFGGRPVDLMPTRSMAVFGLDPVEDAPRRAANAALAMRRAAERSRDHDGDQPWAVKIALHVLDGQLARLGAEVMLDEATKRAASSALETLIGHAGPGDVVVSDAIAPFLERRFDFSRVEDAVARLGDTERSGLGVGERMAQFVGRERDLDVLRSRYELAASGRGQSAGVVGEAGIGKSRLVYELRRQLDGTPATIVEGQCLSYGVSMPYLPVLGIVRALCGIEEQDSAETIAVRVREVLSRHDSEPSRSLSYLLHLLGVSRESDRFAQLAADAVKVGIFESLRGMILGDSRDRALVVLLEDLHWIDPISEEFFTGLMDTLAAARVLIVTTYRPGYRPPWAERSYFTQIALQALSTADSHSIVRTVLGRDVPDDVIDVVLARAEGNPFFLEELARTIREHGDAALTSAVPGTVEEVLLARIRRLPALQQRLLQSAAVIGSDVPLALLRAVVGISGEALDREITELTAAEFIHQKAAAGDAEYRFKHVLTQEVAYWTLLPDERQALHGSIARAIEERHADRLPEHVERLAHHCFRGQVWDQAVAYSRQAGARAAGRSANREAVGYFEQALAALEHCPRSRDAVEAAIDIRFELRNPLHLLADFQKIFDHLREAETLATGLGDEWRLGWVFSYQAQCWRLTGHPDRAIAAGQRALAIAEARGDFRLRIATEMHLGSACEDAGDYRRASTIHRRIVEALVGDLMYERFGLSGIPAVGARAHLASCLAEIGEFEEAAAWGDEAVRIGERVSDPNGLVNAYFAAGTTLLLKGECAGAIPVLERGSDLCQTTSVTLMAPRVMAALGFAYGLSQRVREGLPLLERAVHEAAQLRLTNMSSIFLVWLGDIRVRAGRLDEARAAAESALERSRVQRQRAYEGYALCLLGDIGARQEADDFTRAERSYRDALAVGDELGMRPLAARCHLGLGRLYARSREAARAGECLARAAGLFREMGMRFWLEETERARV